MANILLNGRWQSVGQTQWAPTLTAHDPDPPIALEGAGELIIAPTSISSTAAFGTATVSTGLVISPPSIPSTVTFGTASVTTALTIICTGIAGNSAFGTATLTLAGLIAPAGIPSTVAFGLAVVSTPLPPPPPVAVTDTTDCSTYGLVPIGSKSAAGAIIFTGISGSGSGLRSVGQSGRSDNLIRVGTAGGANCP